MRQQYFGKGDLLLGLFAVEEEEALNFCGHPPKTNKKAEALVCFCFFVVDT
ncbi:hypothetical protein P1X15_00030 [Runella sp. MFBS21]|uniref:hypothetical protein n=1 Tax=Runella sp. MFBS21 TaxID=3034018 RepID=UPI0023F90B77|nr:hypothetical protein [Runella sp. MFBS21]MDF7815947.1 hypothetical protein [Runella sp. MFBS21]